MRERDGKVITFYSYKGGTGRSMALANVAFILASHEKKVLLIDWDLEAPGLHRYFHPFLIDPDLTSTEGLIDFVWDFAMDAVTPQVATSDPQSWSESAADLTPYTVGLDYDFGEGCLDFIPAGRQGPEYSARVNAFNWENFYTRLRGGILLEAVRKRLKREYDFVLIDSRTGVSDTSGICTVQMPDQLVVCFTCNNQSIRGAAAVVESIVEQRGKRDLQIFPVLMRVDLSEKDKLDASRAFARKTFLGYPNHLEIGRRERYWRKSEILYHSYYAYEEVLTVFADSPESDKTLLSDVETLVGHLTQGDIEEIRRIPEAKRLEYKAKFLRSETIPRDSTSLRDPQSIALYEKVKHAQEEWEGSGRRPDKLLRTDVSKELSYAAEVRNLLIHEEGLQTFIEQSSLLNRRRWMIELPFLLLFVLTVALSGASVLAAIGSIVALFSVTTANERITSIVVFMSSIVVGFFSIRWARGFRSGKIYNSMLGAMLSRAIRKAARTPAAS